MNPSHDQVRAVAWVDGALHLLDQRRLPQFEEIKVLEDSDAVAGAIRDMVVRGAPAIGISAAYGAVIAAGARFQAVRAGNRNPVCSLTRTCVA